MEWTYRADNVYLIDTNQFGYEHYGSAYIVKSKEIALIDTGLPNQLETVRARIKEHGFSISDISYIIITHGHGDHWGNTAPLLREATRAKVYIHPAAEHLLLDPLAEKDRVRGLLLPQMIERFGVAEPVKKSDIVLLKDGDVFDLGDGEKLKVIFAPGHLPSGVVILEEKNMGLFINDLVGNYFDDADISMILTPYGTDVIESMKSLNKLADIPVTRLFLGHFGINDNPKKVIQRALNGMQRLLEIGAQCIAEGKPEEIEPRVTASKLPEAEKFIKTRGRTIYEYTIEELIPHQSTSFAKYYLNLQQKS